MVEQINLMPNKLIDQTKNYKFNETFHSVFLQKLRKIQRTEKHFS